MTLRVGDILIDYSYARPDLHAAARSGAKGAIRYTAGAASLPGHPSYNLNRGKLITPGEFRAILAAGMDVVANDEWYEDRITEGASAGQQDASAAATVWRSCGLAKGSAILVSWDKDPVRSKWPAARSYLRAYQATLRGYGYELGVYAGTPFLRYVSSSAFARFVIRYLWRPNAGSWSGDGLPYQPDTSTAAKRAALVRLALPKTPAHIWQTGSYWFNKSADENLILRLPIGSHLEAVAAKQPRPPADNPDPIPDPINGKELTLTPQEKAYFDAKFAQLADRKTLLALFSDSKGKPHLFRTWLTKLSGKKVDFP